jgi:hypothetical protein
MRPMKTVAAFAMIFATTSAYADSRAQVGTSMLVFSGNSDVKSPGYFGGAASLGAWIDRVALVAELGKTTWEENSSMSWTGLAARLAFVDHETCRAEGCVHVRLWGEAGLAHESWSLDQDSLTGSGTRTSSHFGGGVDFGGGHRRHLEMTMFFRVQRAQVPDSMSTLDLSWGPYTTSLVFGLGLSTDTI